MSVQAGRSELPSARRRSLVALGLLRALATAVVLVALYYLLPFDRFTSMRLALAGGLLVLLAGGVWQLRAIVRVNRVKRASRPSRRSPWPATGRGIREGQPPQHSDGAS